MDHGGHDNLLNELLNQQWERVMTVFEAWDEAGDVDRAELLRGMAALGIDTSEVDRVFATFGQGSSAMLDVRELSAALRTHKDEQEAATVGRVTSAPLRVRRSSRLQGQAVKQALAPPQSHPPTHPFLCPLASRVSSPLLAPLRRRLGSRVACPAFGRPAKAWHKHLPPASQLQSSLTRS